MTDIIKEIDRVLGHIEGINDERDAVPILLQLRRRWPIVINLVEQNQKTIAALIAAAQVAEPPAKAIVLCDQELENATIERCAQVADAELKTCQENGDADDDVTIGQVGAASRIAAAIRKLKDQPWTEHTPTPWDIRTSEIKIIRSQKETITALVEVLEEMLPYFGKNFSAEDAGRVLHAEDKARAALKLARGE